MNSIEFERLPEVDDLSGLLEDVFGVKLDIEGGWGYDPKTAVVVNSLDVPVEQFLHMYASMRANVIMNLTLEEEDRFGAINATFLELKQFALENKVYDVATFKITAMKEKVYAELIQEYKDNYGKEDFDLDAHFKRREESSYEIDFDHWFYNLEQK